MDKTFYIKTYGCQMNVYDSQKIEDILMEQGYKPTTFPENARLLLLNTCHVREKATEKVFSELGRLKPFKDSRLKKGLPTFIGVCGCVAQAEGQEIIKRASFVDMVIGPQSYHQLPSMLEKAEGSSRSQVETDFLTYEKLENLPYTKALSSISQFLTIQEGCDKFCAFCSVPYTRGAEVSRPVDSVLDEAKHLIEKGAKSITLLGQNVTAYHGTKNGSQWSIADLIMEMGNLPGLKRLSYTTSHPRDMQNDLVAAHRECPILMPFLHLPVQSGSNRLLKAMNRRYSWEEYIELITAFKSARPDLAISSDFIVGFPGETEEDFIDTLTLIDKVQYSQGYSFIYSPRAGTPGAVLENLTQEKEQQERLKRIQEKLAYHQKAFNLSWVGREVEVLFEKRGKNPHQMVGKTPYMQNVYAPFDEKLIGSFCRVHIAHASLSSLGGTIV